MFSQFSSFAKLFILLLRNVISIIMKIRKFQALL